MSDGSLAGGLIKESDIGPGEEPGIVPDKKLGKGPVEEAEGEDRGRSSGGPGGLRASVGELLEKGR